MSIICVLLIVLGVFTLLGGLMMVVIGTNDFMIDLLADMGLSGFENVIVALGVYGIISGLLTLVATHFLYNGKTLGWYLIIVILVSDSIFNIFMFSYDAFSAVFGLIFTIPFIWYFFRSNVREYFSI